VSIPHSLIVSKRSVHALAIGQGVHPLIVGDGVEESFRHRVIVPMRKDRCPGVVEVDPEHGLRRKRHSERLAVRKIRTQRHSKHVLPAGIQAFDVHQLITGRRPGRERGRLTHSILNRTGSGWVMSMVLVRMACLQDSRGSVHRSPIWRLEPSIGMDVAVLVGHQPAGQCGGTGTASGAACSAPFAGADRAHGSGRLLPHGLVQAPVPIPLDEIRAETTAGAPRWLRFATVRATRRT